MDPFYGQIQMFCGEFAPRGWAFCHGQLLKISGNSALFSILGTTYGGDGRTTFALPDFRGRVAISEGTGAGLSPRILWARIQVGAVGGSENNVLTLENLAPHNHMVTGDVTVGVNEEDPSTEEANGSVLGNTPNGDIIYNNTAAGTNEKLADVSHNLSTSIAGSSEPINNMAPYHAVNYIICLYGIYPSRN